MFIDTHIHLDQFEEEGCVPELLERAASAGVERGIAIGGDAVRNELAVKYAKLMPERLKAAIGYDRDLAAGDYSLDLLEQQLDSAGGAVAAIGEIGLDYHYHPETAPEQEALFQSMLEVALARALPVVIHSRNADDRSVSILRDYVGSWRGDQGRAGVLHCFTGGPDFAEKLIELDLYISFSGISTFRTADDIRAAAAIVPAEKILLETDSPYLAPVPHRGKRNEPMYVPDVARVIADVRGISVDELADITTTNACRLFGISS